MSTVDRPKTNRKSRTLHEPKDHGDSDLNGRRKTNYTGRRTMQELLPKTRDFMRLLNCGSHGILVNGRTKVKVKNTKGKITAGWSGLATCGSVWAEPVCAQKIAATRSLEILNAMNEWQKQGHANSFVTLTARHNRDQSYVQVADAVTKAFQAVISGKAWIGNQKDYGVESPGNTPRLYSTKTNKATGETTKIYTLNRLHFIRVLETTHSDHNGWHVHIHAALFHAAGLKDKQIHELARSLFGRWEAALVREGFDAPTFRHGIDVKRVIDGDTRWIKDYLTKATYKAPSRSHTASEIAGGTGKKGRWVEIPGEDGDLKWVASRTPFQILEDLSNRYDTRDHALWTEFVIGSTGRRQITWSTGLRKTVGLDEIEPTDDEIAAKDAEGLVDIVLSNTSFKIIHHRAEDVLETREVSHEAALDFLAHYGITPLADFDEASPEYQVAHAEWLQRRKGNQQKGKRRKHTFDKAEARELALKHVNQNLAHQKRLAKEQVDAMMRDLAS